MTKKHFETTHNESENIHNSCNHHSQDSCCKHNQKKETSCCSNEKQHTCCRDIKNHNDNHSSCSCKTTKTTCCQEENELSQLIKENQLLKEQIKDKEQKYLLSLAEAENSRKRLQKERQELTKYAVENILLEILYPMENLENALSFAKNMSDEVKNWAVGFEMILGQFKNILSENGVVEYTAINQIFDPHLHEAVETVETNDYPEGFIIQEFAKGYKIGERPIRVAKVKVAKKVQQNEINEKHLKNNE